MAAGYIKLRRGLLDHIEDGRMDERMLFAFVWLSFRADHQTGEVFVSAADFDALPKWSKATGWRTLKKLKDGKYIEEVERRHRSRTAYKIAKWNKGVKRKMKRKQPQQKRDLAFHRGEGETQDETHAAFLPITSEVQEEEYAGKQVSPQKTLTDLWFSIFEYCTKSKPTWTRACAGSLKTLLKKHDPATVTERMKKYARRWRDDEFYRSQGLDWLAFVRHFDRLATWTPDQARTGSTANDTAEAATAWERVMSQVRSVGSYGSPDLDDRSRNAVRKAGGWAAVCGADEYRIKTIRRAFMDAWKEER